MVIHRPAPYFCTKLITMKKTAILLLSSLLSLGAIAQDNTGKEDSADDEKGLVIGGYGEAVYSYNMYSDSPYRYMFANRYKDAQGHGRFDLPHVVFMLGYNFGKGWSVNSEIEFEHGGTGATIEVEGDEAVELEHEIERGGEVVLEQFWIQKSFKSYANIRAGMIIVPVGLTNSRHEPDKYFTVYRQEGESTIFPCTWHQIGISFWGEHNGWKYEFQLLPGLNSRLFNNSMWINGASASPYEYTVANSLAGAFRIDNSSIEGTRFGISGYIGGTDNDAYPRVVNSSGKVSNTVKGTVFIITADAQYKGKHVTARANGDFGYLTNASEIGTSNKNSDNSTFSPYSHSFVGKMAWAAGAEGGVDIFSYIPKLHKHQLYVFGRYEAYDSYIPAENVVDYKWSDKQRIALGINYIPVKGLVLKAEWSHRFLAKQYNPEPSFNIGITYSCMFSKLKSK